MDRINKSIIQFHAVASILGYWCVHALLSLFVGETGRVASITYDGIQCALSIYVMIICAKEMIVERGRSLLTFFALLLVLYTVRMVLDMIGGPFLMVLPRTVFYNDFLLTVFCNFFAAWAIIASRRHLNIEAIVKTTFIMSSITIFAIIINLRIHGLSDAYEEERLDIGRGLGSLALAKIGALQIIAALHLLLNSTSRKWIYILGLLMGGWLTLASGSRGGLAGLAIALGIYWLVSSRRKPLMAVVSIVTVTLFVINIVPILTWLSDYFPVVGHRMLNTILENEQSGREVLRRQAFELITEHPFFGYSYRLNTDITGYGAHNGILNVFLALGIPVGLLFVYFVYIKGFVIAIRIMRERRYIFSSILLIFVFVASMSGSSITDSRFNFAVCIIGALYYYHYKKQPLSQFYHYEEHT